MAPERKLLNECHRLIATMRAAGRKIKAVKYHGNAYSKSGTPDLHITLDGRSVWCELKAEGGVISALQHHELKEWAASGAICGVCWSREEFIELLKLADGMRPSAAGVLVIKGVMTVFQPDKKGAA